MDFPSNVNGEVSPHGIDSPQRLNNIKYGKPPSIVRSAFQKSNNFSSSPLPKTTTAQDMLSIYNKLLCKNEVLTKRKAQFLVACFNKKFFKSLEKWKEYLERIRSSLYLMSERFFICLNNILKYSLMDRILSGELGVKWKPSQREMLNREEDLVREISEQISNLKENEACIQTRLTILRKYGSSIYNSWFGKTMLTLTSDGVEPLNCNSFVRDYIKNNFYSELCL